MSPNLHFAPYDRSDVPIPTTRPPISSGTTVRRAKTLTRPERGIAPVPLIKPSSSFSPAVPIQSDSGFDPWRIFSQLITFWAPGFLLSSIGGLKDKQKQQAWREKVALCFIALFLGGLVGFFTVGMQRVLCPSNSTTNTDLYSRLGSVDNSIGVQGWTFINSDSSPSTIDDLVANKGQDITPQFQRSASDYPSCTGLDFRIAKDDPCGSSANCQFGDLNDTSTFSTLGISNTSKIVGYDWSQVAGLDNYFVIDGAVLNMQPYISLHTSSISGDDVDAALRSVLQASPSGSGKDATRLFYTRSNLKSAVPCLKERYYAGNIDKILPGCFVSNLVLYAGLIVILALVLVRFAMACVFSWYLSGKLAAKPKSAELNRTAISPAVLPGGANIAVDNRTGTAPWTNGGKLKKGDRVPPNLGGASINGDTASPTITLAQIGAELFAVCLVTCYSEGEDSLRTTLDSISQTTYSDQRKLLFVIADGMITGAGEKRSTPDTCVSLLEADPRFGDPMPMSYIAVGSGRKKENRAMVYAGHYSKPVSNAT